MPRLLASLRAHDRDCSGPLSSICAYKLAQLPAPNSVDPGPTQVGVDREGRVWARGAPLRSRLSFKVWAVDCSGLSSRRPSLLQVEPAHPAKLVQLEGEYEGPTLVEGIQLVGPVRSNCELLSLPVLRKRICIELITATKTRL